MDRSPSPRYKRSHVVLIPGFGGFDALGQLAYYSGITPMFRARNAREEELFYFDNFPTAAVATRAARLQRFLAKLFARGAISRGDEITLIGHSTGGLDIRQAVWDLHGRQKAFFVDGGVEVGPETILRCLKRVVFLSVPHWGTNVADWTREQRIWREAVVAELRAAVAGSQVPVVDRIENWLATAATFLTGSGLLQAVEDSLREADDDVGDPGPERDAYAHEAASELSLYLRQMASDFRAIDDLTSRRPPRRAGSPAHFNEQERTKEMTFWKGQIECRSYATLESRPFRFPEKSPAPEWDLLNPFAYPEVCKDAVLSRGTDMAYRFCYRACAGGPFAAPANGGAVTRYLGAPPDHDLEVWDNDGIVNTLSMLWPLGENVLVRGDHMDIVGQYEFVEAPAGCGRRYQTYNLLQEASRFGAGMFGQVWNEIFDFCAGGVERRRVAAASV